MTKNQSTSLIVGLLLFSALLSIAGGLFKLQHFPYGSELLIIIGIFWIISIVLIVSTSVQRKKKSEGD